MHVGKCLTIALKNKGTSQVWLGIQMGVATQRVNQITKSESCNTSTLTKVVKALDMSLDEFQALGE